MCNVLEKGGEMQPVMNVAELNDLMARVFPQVDGQFEVVALGAEGVIMRMPVDDRHLRPGGTVSGPSMFALADCAFYMAVLAMIGPRTLSVTTNCCIDFLRKPAPGDLIGTARILKLGKRLCVGDVLIHSDAHPEGGPVARASVTYAIAPAGLGQEETGPAMG